MPSTKKRRCVALILSVVMWLSLLSSYTNVFAFGETESDDTSEVTALTINYLPGDFEDYDAETNGEMESQTISDSESYTLTPNGFNRGDHTFSGWSNTTNGQDIADDPDTDEDESVTAFILPDMAQISDFTCESVNLKDYADDTGNLNLYAVWEAVQTDESDGSGKSSDNLENNDSTNEGKKTLDDYVVSDDVFIDPNVEFAEDEVKTDENGLLLEQTTTNTSLLNTLMTAMSTDEEETDIPTYGADDDVTEGDGTTIEKIQASWTTNGAGTNKLVLNPTTNDGVMAAFRVEYSLSGQYEYEAGDIEIRIPVNIFTDRNDAYEGNMTLAVPEDPDKGATFNYRKEGNEYILTNTKKLSAASQGYFEFTIRDIIPSEIISGTDFGPFTAVITVTTHEGNTLKRTSNDLYAQINTDEQVTAAYKKGTVYENFPSSWSSKVTFPEGFDTSQYIYVDWYTYCYVTGNQYFTIGIDDPILDDGILLGGTLSGQAGNATYSSDNLFTGYVSDGHNFYHHLYVAYPLDYFPALVGNTVHNTVTYTLTSLDTSHVTTAKASAFLKYTPIPFSGGAAGLGQYRLYKYGNKYPYAINQLANGNNVDIAYTVKAQGYTFPDTLGDNLDPDLMDSYKQKYVDFEITDETLYLDLNTILDGTDYEFTKLTISKPTMYQFAKNSSGVWGYMGTSNAVIPDITIFGRAGSGNWIQYGTASWSTGSLVITPVNGASVSGSALVFPEGITGYKTTYSTNEAGIYWSCTPTIKLFANERLSSMAQELMENSDSAQKDVWNQATMNVSIGGSSRYRESVVTNDRLTSAAQTFKIEKTQSSVTNNVSQMLATWTYTATVTEGTNLTSASDWKNATVEDAVKADHGGVFWDLLPEAVTIDQSSITVDKYSSIDYVKLHENWRDSGRTMLEVGVSHTPTAQYINSYYGDKLTISFKASYTWVDMNDRGKKLTNVISYGTNEEWMGTVEGLKGEPDDPQFGNNDYSKSAVASVGNYMTNLDETRDDPSWVYARCAHTINVDTMAVTGLQKDVSILNSGNWGTGLGENSLTVPEGGVYTYRLRMTSDTSTSTKNIILYDDLEAYIPTQDKADYNDKQWTGYFRSLDLSQIKAMGVNPVVYYAVSPIDLTQYILDETTTRLPDLSDTNVWTTTCPSDPSTVRAIAIDCRKDTDGNDFVLEEGESLQALVNMRAPTGDQVTTWVEQNAHAYNNVYMFSTTIANSGEESTHYIHQDYTKLGLKQYNIDVTKKWNDGNDQDGIRPASINVQLTRNGMAMDGKTATLSEENEWKTAFEHLAWGDENGKQYQYSVTETNIPDGYKMSVISNSDGELTVTNTHTPATVEISGTKSWDDLGNEDKRPSSIKVTLYKNGSAYKSLQVSESNDWAYSFGSLPVYQIIDGKGGNLIEWTVHETYVLGYIESTDGYDITNTYNPYGDLTLTKTVVNGTDVSNAKLFEFTLTLVDSDGEYDMGEYQWTSTTGRSGSIENGGSITISKDEVITVHNVPSEKTFTWKEKSIDGFTQTSAKNLTGTLQAGQTINTSVENTYSAKGIAQVSASKVLTGRELQKAQFRFELVDSNGTILKTATNKADGSVTFGAISYQLSDVGKTYEYNIREVNAEKPGYTYDSHLGKVTVTVTDNGDGTLNCAVAYPDGEASCVFNNEYHASGTLRLTANKALLGRDLVDGEFTFELLYSDNNPVLVDENNKIVPSGGTAVTATNSADGTVTFPDIQFDETQIGQVWDMKIREVEGDDDTVIYDTHEDAIHLECIDNGDGTLAITTELVGEGNQLFWQNTLQDGTLIIRKQTIGGDGSETFTFDVTITPPEGVELKDGSYEYDLNEIDPLTDDEISTILGTSGDNQGSDDEEEVVTPEGPSDGGDN